MRNLKLLWISLFILASLPVGSTSAASNDEQAVRELVGRYAAARQSQDAKAIEALFTADADQLVSSGEWRRGSKALVSGMLESSRSNSGGRTIIVETVRMLTPDAALADARYEIAATAGGEARRMWSTFLCVRQTGGWRIAAIRNMLPSK
jgi:uncharacterized protein (TIGR02246 family)